MPRFDCVVQRLLRTHNVDKLQLLDMSADMDINITFTSRKLFNGHNSLVG